MNISTELFKWLDESHEHDDSQYVFFNVWNSVDFSYVNIYETIICWLTKTLNSTSCKLSGMPLQQFFQQRAQPGLVSCAMKRDFISAVLARVQTETNPTRGSTTELVQQMLNFELLQDVWRADYEILMRCFGILFESYARYLKTASNIYSDEFKFAVNLLKKLREYVRRDQHIKQLRVFYDEYTLHHLAEVVLHLRMHNICCIEQFAALEKELTEDMPSSELICRCDKSFMHVRLLAMECAILNHQLQINFIKLLVEKSFHNNFQPSANIEPKLALLVTAYLLEALHKHNISLQFYTDKTQSSENVAAFAYIGKQLVKYVLLYKDCHLRELLMVLCAALRLNPLILEENVYEITICLLTSPKSSQIEDLLYSNYLMLLLDMFQRLNRSERFFMGFIKVLIKWLATHELQTPKLKARKITTEYNPSMKPVQCQEYDRNSTNMENLYIALFNSNQIQTTMQCTSRQCSNNSFPQLVQLWPSHTVGIAFTSHVTQLTVKASIVIWKTLLHSLSSLLTENSDTVLPANLDFSIELHAALLCQYLSGTRLIEQIEYNYSDVENQRALSVQVLHQFGRHLIRQEHNRRCMAAFLECVSHINSFDLMLIYYAPDSMDLTLNQEKFQNWLIPTAEWTLIKQRVHNFGKNSCRQQLQRLELELEQRYCLLEDTFHLRRPEKVQHSQQQHQSHLKVNQSDKYVELLALNILEEYIAALSNEQKSALRISELPLSSMHQEPSTKTINTLVNIICQSKQSKKTTSPLPVELSKLIVEKLKQLPVLQLLSAPKFRLWLVLFAFYVDLSNSHLESCASIIFDQLLDMIHFGQPLPICKYFPQIETLFGLLPPSQINTWQFYETLFARCIKLHAPGSNEFVENCKDYLQQITDTCSSLAAGDCRLLLLIIETLQGKQHQQLLHHCLKMYGKFLINKFKSIKEQPAKYNRFVNQNLGGFVVYVNYIIFNGDKLNKERLDIDENFRRIYKIFIGHSLNYRNPHAIRLINFALTHRQLLHLDQDEIEFVLNSYWRQITLDIQSSNFGTTDSMTVIETAIKLIIGYKSNENFLLLVRDMATEINVMQHFETEDKSLQTVLQLLALFAKCPLSNIKAAIFNEYFEHISGTVLLRIVQSTTDIYYSHVLCLLEAQRALAANRTIVLSMETLDNMLSTMLDVKITQYMRNVDCPQQFFNLHSAICANCMVLLRDRHVLISDRVSQMSTLLQRLLQTIICYPRGGGKNLHNLSSMELDGLVDLTVKLAKLMVQFTTRATIAYKRVVPFLIVFVIKEMVFTENSTTTVCQQIKTAMTRICHELIGLCDHRAGHFILRASNEAGARTYKNILKEHNKYHTFKGKA